MKKSIDLKSLRKEMGKTLEQVSRETGIPYSTVRALEIGLGKSFSAGLKQHLADYYLVNLFDAFPEEFEKLQGAVPEGYHIFMVIENWVPDLELDGMEKKTWIEVLSRMSPEEVGMDILHSGQDADNLRKVMKKYIRKYSKIK